MIGGRLAWEPDARSDRTALARGPPALERRRSRSCFEVFPFEHELLYEAQLADGLPGDRRDRATHAAADPVPVAFGFHPYLAPAGPAARAVAWWRCPRCAASTLDAAADPARDRRAAPRRALRARRARVRRRLRLGREARSFAVAAGGMRLAVELLEGYACAQVYAPRVGRFICFEPMSRARRTRCAAATGLRLLAPRRARAGARSR